MRLTTCCLIAATVSICCSAAASQPAASFEPSPEALAIMSEIERAMTLELPGMPRPHHIAVTHVRVEEHAVEASLGAIVTRVENVAATLKVEVRVGSGDFDSGNYIGTGREPIVVSAAPLDSSPHALQHILWLAADRAYKVATSTFEAKRAYRDTIADVQDRPPDFTPAEVVQFTLRTRQNLPSLDTLTDLAGATSAVFLEYSTIHRSFTRITTQMRYRTFVDSSGTIIEDQTPMVRIATVASTQADDGMVIVDHHTTASLNLADMPSKQELVRSAQQLAWRVKHMRDAQVVSDYVGPVLFEREAAPQLFRFLLADELSATPLPEPHSASDRSVGNLASRIGWRVLPVGFDITDDPTQRTMARHPLLGSYGFDDEGVRAHAVRLVEHGVLKTLLSSRTPSSTVAASNGHGRAGLMGSARGRAANLLITSRNGRSHSALVDELLAVARQEGLAFAIIVSRFDNPSLSVDAVPGDAMQDGVGTDVLLPRPVEAYRLWMNGRVEPLRGVVLAGLRMRDLRQIRASGRELHAHSYFASDGPWRGSGVRGGTIPTTVVAPAVLLPDVDVMRQAPPYPVPPVVPRSTDMGGPPSSRAGD